MNDVYFVVYSSKATDDLREIYVYIAFDLQSPDTAKGQVNHIRKKIRSLNLFGNPSLAIRTWQPDIWLSPSNRRQRHDFS